MLSLLVGKTPRGFQKYSFDFAHYADRPDIEDLAGNGHLELIAPVDFTEYQGAQYCIATWQVIYAWTGDTYSDVSGNYKGYYEKRLAALQKEVANSPTNGNVNCVKAEAAKIERFLWHFTRRRIRRRDRMDER